MTINLKQLLADREAGMDGPWTIESYECRADPNDVKFAKSEGRKLEVGDVLWSVPISTGPVVADHNHWAGTHLALNEEDTRRIARLPDLEAAFLEAVGHIEAALDDDRKWGSEAEAFLEKLK